MRKCFLIAALILAASGAFSSAFAGVIHVSKTGDDATGTGSAVAPFATIQKGITSAAPGDTVEVAAGTYVENVDFTGKAVTVKSTNPDDPSVVAATIIDGSNSGHVVTFAASETRFSVLTGFTIRNGRADVGGGIYCQSSSPTITKNVITGNSLTGSGMYRCGGGVGCSGGAPLISYNTITGNTARRGAGVGAFDGSTAEIRNNIIMANTASEGGGAIYCHSSSPTVAANSITNNRTTGGDGGAILTEYGGPMTISDNVIAANTANGGGGVSCIYGASAVVTGNVFTANFGHDGGGAMHFMNFDTATLANNVVCGNRAIAEGGGGILCNGNGTATITNCTVAQNSAKENCGGVVAEWGSAVNLSNCIVWGNSGPKANELATWGSGAILSANYCDVAGGQAGVYNDGATLIWPAGNIDADPLFASLGSWNDNGTPSNYGDDVWTDGDYHEKSRDGRWDPKAAGGAGAWVLDPVSSPCIDAGYPASPWSHEPEPNGERINMGAFGNTPFASMSPGAGITMAVSPADSGTTIPPVGAFRAPLGKPRAIQAIPESFCVFQHWTASPPGNASLADANSASTTVTATADVTVTAVFTATVGAPLFSPEPGSYAAGLSVSLDCPTKDAAIRYTLDGSVPTASSTLYSSPINVASTVTIKAVAMKPGWQDSTVAAAVYRIDGQAPVARDMATIPTVVREKKDKTLTLTATADDAATGGSNIAGGEYFVGPEPPVGGGTAMQAADAAFDSPVEALTATLNTASWTIGVRHIGLRARDAAGNWSSTVAVDVPVVDGTPPGAVTDLAANALGSLDRVSVALNSYSSAYPGSPATALLDANPSTAWQTAGTPSAETEFVVLDAFIKKTVGGVVLAPGQAKPLFPSAFTVEVSDDAVTWTRVAGARGFKAGKAAYLWQFEPVDARYVKISGPGVYNPRDRRFYWQIADAALYRGGGAFIELTWTAPADDGYIGTPASEYDVRFSPSQIISGNFAACACASGLPGPASPASAERAVVNVGFDLSTVYFALKTADEVPNWSNMSNVVNVPARVTAFVSRAPAAAISIAPGAPPTFQFCCDVAAKPVFIAFSSCADFVTTPSARNDGQVDRSVKFPVRPGATSWIPSPGQWKTLKKLLCTEGVLYWRLEGVVPSFGTAFGPVRSLLFDCGDINGLSVGPSHQVGSDEGIYPDVSVPPTFAWANNTSGMKYFFVDVSTDETVPLSNKKKTLVLGGGKISGSAYVASKAEWKNLRKLAAPVGGVLYWRVRAQDSDKAFEYASAVKKLVVDGGQFTLTDLDLGAASPAVSWTCTASGLTNFSLEFSINADFKATPKETVRVPAKPVSGSPYVLQPPDLTRIKRLATAHSATTVYYRVRGEDAERAFFCTSDPKIVSVP